MTTGRIPVFATIVVVAAAALMVALGFWQLGRLEEKRALLARYAAASVSGPVAFPTRGEGGAVLFRPSTVDCTRVIAVEPTAGRSLPGASGWAQRARCETEGGGSAVIDLGWSRDPQPVAWTGGRVEGIIAPGPRLVATTPPVAGLEPLAPPDPSSIPNNHLAYAGQWFFFALTALVIYFLALRRRGSDTVSPGIRG